MTTDWYREESLYQKVSTKKNIWRTTHQTVNSYALEESLSSACAKFSGLWWHPCHSNFPGSLYSRQMQSDITFACCSQNTNLCFQTELGSPNMGTRIQNPGCLEGLCSFCYTTMFHGKKGIGSQASEIIFFVKENV
ncbi:uncharacterized protein RBU33_003651 isoform 1-T3 [Hipposideros larvatus]